MARSNSVLEIVSPRSKREPDSERRVVNVYDRFCLLVIREDWKASKFGVSAEPRCRLERIIWQRS